MRPARPAGGVPVLAARLAVPAPPPVLVTRPRLAAALEAGTAGPLTLVTAPAGWGKTVLLGWWARTAGPPVAWLTAAPGDDAERFWPYLAAALRCSGGVPAGAVPDPPRGPDGPGQQAFLGRLGAALAGLAEPVVCVLDEAHEVTDARVWAGLAVLLRATGGRLRLVCAGRARPEPLERAGVPGGWTLLSAAQLSFTPAEAVRLLAAHGTALTRDALAALHARTEGWPAGLHLAALSLRGHPNPGRFVAEFVGDDREVSGYLLGEVLAGLSGEVRDLLLATSVLDRVCGPMVDRLTGRTDGAAVLAELARANVFLTAVGGGWYRFHPLFAGMLRAELRRRRPEQVPELHREAAHWLSRHGQPVDALRHALAARQDTLAVRLLAERWHDLALAGHGEMPGTGVPAPAHGAVRADPHLALAHAADRLDLRDGPGARRYLHLAERHRDQVPTRHRQRFDLIGAVFRLSEARITGEPAGLAAAAGQVLDLAGDSGGAGGRGRVAAARALALSALGTAQLCAAQADTAERTLATGLGAAGEAGLGCQEAAYAGQLAVVQALRGKVRTAERTARLALEAPPCPGRRCGTQHTAQARLAVAIAAFSRGELAIARHLVAGIAGVADGSGLAPDPPLVVTVAVTHAWTLLASGDLTGGHEVLAGCRRRFEGWSLPAVLASWLAVTEAELYTAGGNTEAAWRLLRALDDGSPSLLQVAIARAQLRDRDPAAAARTLATWPDAWDGHPYLLSSVQAGVLAAVAGWELGERRQAFRRLEQVLALADVAEHRQAFVFGGPPLPALLAAYAGAGSHHQTRVGELIAVLGQHAGAPAGGGSARLSAPLTPQELVILRYLQGNQPYRDIAAGMTLSVNTVKTHVRNLYRKLGTGSRREAIRRARELRLI